MKRSCAVLLAAVSAVALAGGEIQIVRQGAAAGHAPGKSFEARVVRLLESCDVDASQAMTEPLWAGLLAGPDFLRVVLKDGPRKITTDGAGVYLVGEILVKLPPDSLPGLIYTKAGNQLHACAMYDPRALFDVVKEPALGLADVPPYSSLAILYRR